MQVMSVTETQYSGANIVLISPDSDNLSVLQVTPPSLLRDVHLFMPSVSASAAAFLSVRPCII